MKKMSVMNVKPVPSPNGNLRNESAVTIYGIDLSHNNGSVDWVKIKLNVVPISFAYIKCTNGVNTIDPKCVEHSNGASAAGMPFGFYHFATLNSQNVIQDATAEAKAFDSAMKTMAPCRLMPALDIEKNDANLSPAQVQLWISTFLSVIDLLGRKNIILYSNRGFLDSYLPANHPFGNIPLWHSQYTTSTSPHLPRGWNKYTAWQFSETGKVNGVNTNCDVSRSTSDLLAMPG